MAGRPRRRARAAGLYGKSNTLFQYLPGPPPSGVVCSTRSYTIADLMALQHHRWLVSRGGYVPDSALEQHFRRMPAAIAEGGRVHSTHHRTTDGRRCEIITHCRSGKLITTAEFGYRD